MGLNKHSVHHTIIEDDKPNAHNGDLHIFWSMKHKPIINHCQENNLPFLCLERGYIDRNTYASVNLNGLNGHSQLLMTNACNSRISQKNWLRLPMLDGKETGIVTVIGQVQSDHTCSDINLQQWIDNIFNNIKDHSKHPLFRPCPLCKLGSRDFEESKGSLHDCFEESEMIITYSSNVGVDAVMQ